MRIDRLADHLRTREPIRYGSLPDVTAAQRGNGERSTECNLVACRREFGTADAAGGVGILPPNRSSRVDISAKLSRQVGDGREWAACNDVTLTFGEPEFNLVEP